MSASLTNILGRLVDESAKTREMLEELRRESRQTREDLTSALRMLAEAVQLLRQS